MSERLSNLGFGLTLVFNSILIYITIFKIKSILGAYKRMVVVFAFLGILFSSLKMIAHPFGHNYNRALIIFSLDIWKNKSILGFLVAAYSGFYTLILSFLAVQFVYRLLTLINLHLAKKFQGVGVLGWGLYPVICGGIYTGLYYAFAMPDEYSDGYLRAEIFEIYNMNIDYVAHFILIPYAPDNSLRWDNLCFIIFGGCLLNLQYLIIIFCGIRMHFTMKNQLGNLSMPNRKLQKQFFQALIVQTVVPTFLFVFPAIPLLTGPLLDVEWSMQTGIIVSLLSLYPPIDSIVFMVIVSEYRKIIKDFCLYLSSPSLFGSFAFSAIPLILTIDRLIATCVPSQYKTLKHQELGYISFLLTFPVFYGIWILGISFMEHVDDRKSDICTLPISMGNSFILYQMTSSSFVFILTPMLFFISYRMKSLEYDSTNISILNSLIRTTVIFYIGNFLANFILFLGNLCLKNSLENLEIMRLSSGILSSMTQCLIMPVFCYTVRDFRQSFATVIGIRAHVAPVLYVMKI